jgi:hypothetical protein
MAPVRLQRGAERKPGRPPCLLLVDNRARFAAFKRQIRNAMPTAGHHALNQGYLLLLAP